MASASATPTSIPGAHAALAHISSNDQGGLVAVLAALAWTFIFVAFSIRVYVRYKTGPWKLDDNCLAVVTVLSCAQTAIVFYEVNKGLGKAVIPDRNQTTLQKAAFANDIFYIIILYLSKCSVGFLYLRLTPAKGHSVAVWAIMAGSTVWAVMSIMLVSIQCHGGNPWATWSSECTNFFPRWEVIGALDILTELSLFLMAVYLVHGLQMSLKAKVVVVAAFAARVLVIPAAGVRIYYLNPDTLPNHRNLAEGYAVICAQLEIGYGLMAATVPCLKPFIAVYEGPRQPASYYNRSYGSDREYNLKSFNSAQLKSQGTMISTVEAGPSPPRESINGTRGGEGGFRPEQTKYTATVSHRDPKVHTHGGSHRNDRSSDDSRQMIIETKTGWSIEYDASSERGNGTSVNDREIGKEVGSAV